MGKQEYPEATAVGGWSESPYVPESIDKDDLVEANRAWAEAVGLNPNAVYDGFKANSDGFTVTVIATPEEIAANLDDLVKVGESRYAEWGRKIRVRAF